MLFRPFGVGEWIWVTAGSVALVGFRLVPFGAAESAVRDGADVYFFLAGMMVLAEIARRGGMFAWMASHAVWAARGSSRRLFALVYAVGVLVTILLSNDATAIVLTPAVATAARSAKVNALPYVFACAFVSNAASFVLPISNPANLIVFASTMPRLGTWLSTLLLPSLGAVVVTFLALSWVSRSDLRARFEAGAGAAPLSAAGTLSLFGVLAAGTALIVTSSLRGPIGAVTLCAAVAVLVATLWMDRREPAAALAAVSWSILPLVAGLFVLVRGLEVSGTIDRLRGTLAALHALPPGVAVAAVAVATALTANLTNNLPLGVIAGQALAGGSAADGARYGAAIGVDLGPNLSVTGSLATILWLAALRREGIDMGALQFLRLGAIVMPTALLAAVTLLLVTTR